MRATSCLLAAVGVSAQCNLRLINQLVGAPAPSVTLTYSGSFVDEQTAGNAGNYVAVACNGTMAFASWPGLASPMPVTVPFGPGDATWASVLLYGSADAGAAAVATADAGAPLDGGVGEIDVCGLRLLSAAAAPMDILGVSADCSLDCLKDFIGHVRPGELLDLGGVDCAWPWLFDAVSPDGVTVLARNYEADLSERGVYTLVIGGSTAGGLAILSDALPSTSRNLPLALAPFILVGIAIVHALIGRILACFARVAPAHVAAAAVAADVAVGGPFAAILAFFGWDRLVRAGWAEASKGAAVAAPASDLGASLLVVDGGSEEAAPKVPAASAPTIDSAAAAAPPKSTKPLSAGRVHSIDVLRGIALSFMMFVNFGGGVS